MNDIIIIDDIVSKQHQEFIKNYFLSESIDWYFQKDITYEENIEIAKQNYGFSNVIYNFPPSKKLESEYYIANSLLYIAADKINAHIQEILRIRTFLQLPINNQSNDVNNPHRDLNINHLVMLYYVNDSDGDTIIYNETEESDNYTIKETVKPKQGRIVIFDGQHYHSSSRPTIGPRCTININILKGKN
jgi:hypothetical protein